MVSQANKDLGIFHETKVNDGIYTCGYAGYNLVSMGALGQHRGVMAVFYRPEPYLTAESV